MQTVYNIWVYVINNQEYIVKLQMTISYICVCGLLRGERSKEDSILGILCLSESIV